MPTLTIEVSEEQERALRVLSGKLCAVDALSLLAERAFDGVCRPSAWERAWLEQAFGFDWMDELTTDPRAEHRQVPRPGLFVEPIEFED